jgi:hypothetical protein
MSLLQPFSTIPKPPSLAARLCGPALMVGAAAVLLGAGFAMGASGGPGVIEVPAPSVVSDPCTVPDGMTLETLPASDRVQLMRRVLACKDRYHGWISAEQYMKTVATIDDAWTAKPVGGPVGAVIAPVIAQVEPIWASTIRGFSTQYSADSWSAKRALGAPDVFPAAGDDENAWASEGADDRAEWLEVGFAQPRSIQAVEIYETFNPGAVGRVELITTTGKRIEVAVDRQQSGESVRRVAPVSCTSEPIAAVRVHVDSKAVEGWNEIDAIGVLPCK